jgi:hypothetical protein
MSSIKSKGVDKLSGVKTFNPKDFRTVLIIFRMLVTSLNIFGPLN